MDFGCAVVANDWMLSVLRLFNWKHVNGCDFFESFCPFREKINIFVLLDDVLVVSHKLLLLHLNNIIGCLRPILLYEWFGVEL